MAYGGHDSDKLIALALGAGATVVSRAMLTAQAHGGEDNVEACLTALIDDI